MHASWLWVFFLGKPILLFLKEVFCQSVTLLRFSCPTKHLVTFHPYGKQQRLKHPCLTTVITPHQLLRKTSDTDTRIAFFYKFCNTQITLTLFHIPQALVSKPVCPLSLVHLLIMKAEVSPNCLLMLLFNSYFLVCSTSTLFLLFSAKSYISMPNYC